MFSTYLFIIFSNNFGVVWFSEQGMGDRLQLDEEEEYIDDDLIFKA